MYINYENQNGMMIAQRRLRIIIKVRGKSDASRPCRLHANFKNTIGYHQ